MVSAGYLTLYHDSTQDDARTMKLALEHVPMSPTPVSLHRFAPAIHLLLHLAVSSYPSLPAFPLWSATRILVCTQLLLLLTPLVAGDWMQCSRRTCTLSKMYEDTAATSVLELVLAKSDVVLACKIAYTGDYVP